LTGNLVIAVDAMGGDQAPAMVVEGIGMARKRFPDARFLVFGDEGEVRPYLDGSPEAAAVTEVRHTPNRVTDDAKPSQALKSGRDTSMFRAIEAVTRGEAQAVVSAGNTGALMGIARFVLKTLPGIERPAIVTYFPTERGESVMLDLGANVECGAKTLVEFAVMGEVFARAVLGLTQPTVGLLNIGAEELKGNEAVKQAANSLRESTLPISFQGFVEGTDIGYGAVDVVVTDGFTGNVALKTVEGTSRLYSNLLKKAFRSSLLARLGYFLSRGAINRLRDRVDPRRYNGAMLVGLNGVVVKSHGGTDPFGFANALGVAIDLVQHRFNHTIKEDFARLSGYGEPEEPEAARA